MDRRAWWAAIYRIAQSRTRLKRLSSSSSSSLLPNKLWKILRDGNIRSPYLPPAKPVCRSRSKLQPDMEQRTSSKLGKEYIKAVYCHPAYLTCMQSTSCKMLGWIKPSLESRLPGEITTTSDMQMIPPLWQKVKRN